MSSQVAVETAIGIGLLVRPLRMPAVVGAISMHTFILFAIGPWGHDWNSVVWPWNVAMVTFGSILFWRVAHHLSLLTVMKPEGSAFRAVVLVVFTFMPVLNFFGMWDSYLSASLYSNSAEEGYVYVTDGPSTVTTSIVAMAIEETNAPAYPEARVYKRVFADAWCERPSLPEPILLVYDRPEIFTGQRSETTYRCKDVRESS